MIKLATQSPHERLEAISLKQKPELVEVIEEEKEQESEVVKKKRKQKLDNFMGKQNELLRM